MKRSFHLVSILAAAIISFCFSITAFADEKNYDIDFTREEAYDAVMNTTPTQAKNLYGGDASYYEALTQEDKEQLFDMMWKATESGILYEDTGTDTTIHLNGFLDDYFSAVIFAFADADSAEEGLNNLHNDIDDAYSQFLSDDSSEYDNVEIVEKKETEVTSKRIEQDVTTAAEAAVTTSQVTTIPVTAQKNNNHTGLIIFLCVVAVSTAAGFGIWFYNAKKKKSKK